MKKAFSLILFLLASASPLFSQKEGIEREYRKFTGSNGKIIEAVLVDRSDDKQMAALLLKNGKRATVPFDSLSEEDQKYVKEWNKEEAVFLQSCRSLSVRQLLELRGYEAVPFTLNHNAMMVEGTLDGRPLRIQIDTGAFGSVLDLNYALDSGLKVGPLDEVIYGIAGETKAGQTPVKSLQFGESIFLDESITTADLHEDMPEGFERRNDILLGADYLMKLETVISYKERLIFFRPDLSDKNEIPDAEESKFQTTEDGFSFRIFKLKDGRTLRGTITSKTTTAVNIKLINGREETISIRSLSQDDSIYAFEWSEAKNTFMQHCRSLTVEELLELRAYQSFKYEREGRHIFVDGTMNKKDARWMIDTGADGTHLHLHHAEAYGCRVGPLTEKVYGIGGVVPAAKTEIDEITMGSAVLKDRVLLASDMARFVADDQLKYVGLFGADFMRELNAVITYRESRIFLKQSQ